MAYTDDDYLGNHGSSSRTAAMIDESPQLLAARREIDALRRRVSDLLAQDERWKRWERDKLERERLIRAGFALGSATASWSVVRQAEHLAALIAQECP